MTSNSYQFHTRNDFSVHFAGIITKKDDQPAAEYAADLKKWLKVREVDSELNQISAEMDILIILGGDGTLLHIAEKASHLSIPVIGINLGHLGFLTELTKNEAKEALEKIITGTVTVENRLMLRTQLISKDGQVVSRYALNDIVINKNSLDRILHLSTFANDDFITTYKADGLIFSTPTGSTAYSLSTGGPLVYPGLASILITPICPFMLGSRPILLAPDMRITTRFDKENSSASANVILDGQPCWTMTKNETLIIDTANKPLRLITSPHRDYFAILRNKLHWGNQETTSPIP